MLLLDRFMVEKEIARSEHSLEFICSDVQSAYNYKYLLRIPAGKKIAELAEGNYEHEFARIARYRKKYFDPRAKRDKQIYGLLGDRYLVMVSDPYVKANVWSIENLMLKCPLSDVPLSSLWEIIALQMMSEAHFVDENRLSESEWLNFWATLSGGSTLVDAISMYLENGELSRTEKLRILTRVSVKYYNKPEFAENILLRLLIAIEKQLIEPESLMDTLKCDHFRRNITSFEVVQISKALDSLGRQLNKAELEAKCIQIVLALLDSPPVIIAESLADLTFQTNRGSLDYKWCLESL